jgi:hypothetical protein
MTKIAGSGSIRQRHGSAVPDLHQNVMDPEHWFILFFRVGGGGGVAPRSGRGGFTLLPMGRGSAVLSIEPGGPLL